MRVCFWLVCVFVSVLRVWAAELWSCQRAPAWLANIWLSPLHSQTGTGLFIVSQLCFLMAPLLSSPLLTLLLPPPVPSWFSHDSLTAFFLFNRCIFSCVRCTTSTYARPVCVINSQQVKRFFRVSVKLQLFSLYCLGAAWTNQAVVYVADCDFLAGLFNEWSAVQVTGPLDCCGAEWMLSGGFWISHTIQLEHCLSVWDRILIKLTLIQNAVWSNFNLSSEVWWSSIIHLLSSSGARPICPSPGIKTPNSASPAVIKVLCMRLSFVLHCCKFSCLMYSGPFSEGTERKIIFFRYENVNFIRIFGSFVEWNHSAV